MSGNLCRREIAERAQPNEEKDCNEESHDAKRVAQPVISIAKCTQNQILTRNSFTFGGVAGNAAQAFARGVGRTLGANLGGSRTINSLFVRLCVILSQNRTCGKRIPLWVASEGCSRCRLGKLGRCVADCTGIRAASGNFTSRETFGIGPSDGRHTLKVDEKRSGVQQNFERYKEQSWQTMNAKKQ